MFDNKFIVTLMALIIGVIAICNFNKKNDQITEEFGMNPSGATYTTKALHDPTNNSFVSSPHLQSSLSPRFTNTDIGANIRYNKPAEKYMASPPHPLGNACGLANNITENFTTPPNCNPQSAQNFASPVNQVNSADVSSILPVGTMEQVGADGESTQSVVFDRFMFANRNSNLRSQGDWIRGDLVPCCATGKDQAWIPPVIPSLDLQQGSLAIIGGVDNSNLKNMAALVNNGSGSTTIAGVQWSSQDLISAGAGLTDINVTGFV